jgi:hypothetical protein
MNRMFFNKTMKTPCIQETIKVLLRQNIMVMRR